MSRRYARREALLVEPLGSGWVAYSPASGDTVLLNDESAAMLEVLAGGPLDTAGVCAALAADAGVEAATLTALIADSWRLLIESGLVSEVPVAGGLTA